MATSKRPLMDGGVCSKEPPRELQIPSCMVDISHFKMKLCGRQESEGLIA